MIEKSEAKKQIARLSGLSYFPTSDEGVRELVTVLTGCDSEGLAKAIIDEELRERVNCPKPAELRAKVYARNELEIQAQVERTRACRECGGRGWLLSYWLHTRHSTHKERQRITESEYNALMWREDLPPTQTLYSGSERCQCRRAA